MAKSLKIKALKTKARYVKPYRSTLPIVAGALLIVVSIVFYLK